MGEPVDGVADDLDVRRPPRHAARIRSTSSRSRASSALRLGRHRLQGDGRGEHGRHAGVAGHPARRPRRSSSGSGERQRVPVRTASTPTPGGPPQDARVGDQQVASRQGVAPGRSPRRRPAAGRRRRADARPRRPAGGCPTSSFARSAGRRARCPRRAALRRKASRSTRPCRSTGTATTSPPRLVPARGVQHRGVLDGAVHQPVAGAAPRRASAPEHRRVHGLGVRAGEATLVGAGAEGARRRLARAVQQQPGPPALARAGGAGRPSPRRARPAGLARRRVQRRDRGGVQVRAPTRTPGGWRRRLDGRRRQPRRPPRGSVAAVTLCASVRSALAARSVEIRSVASSECCRLVRQLRWPERDVGRPTCVRTTASRLARSARPAPGRGRPACGARRRPVLRPTSRARLPADDRA